MDGHDAMDFDGETINGKWAEIPLVIHGVFRCHHVPSIYSRTGKSTI